MKIYVVTSGEYSSYHIDAVFTDEESAWKYASLDLDRFVEEYETDSVQVDGMQNVYYRCRLDLGCDRIVDVKTLYEKGENRIQYTDKTDYFIFYLANSATNYKAVSHRQHSNNSRYLLQIAHDMLAKHADTVGKSIQDITNEAVKKIQDMEETEQQRKIHVMMEWLRNTEINYRIRKVLEARINSGEPLPNEKELNNIAEKIRSEVMESENEVQA